MNKADTTGIISSIYDLSLQGCPSRVGIGYAGSKTAVPPDAFPGGRWRHKIIYLPWSPWQFLFSAAD